MISELSGVEAREHLHRFIAESTKLEAFFVGNGVDASVVGVLRLNPDGQYCVSETATSGAHISVNPKNFSAGKFADKSSLPELFPLGVLVPIDEFSSALTFKMKDGSVLSFFEIAKAN
jgi:hypothetical protein